MTVLFNDNIEPREYHNNGNLLPELKLMKRVSPNVNISISISMNANDRKVIPTACFEVEHNDITHKNRRTRWNETNRTYKSTDEN